MGVSKFVYGNQVKFDITDSTVTADTLAKDRIAYGADGEKIIGTSTKDSDTSDANAVAGDIASGKTAYVNGNKITGTIPLQGAVDGTISNKDTPYSIEYGIHDGSGTVSIAETEKAKLIPGNIKKDVSILGVTGTFDPSGDIKAQTKSVTPAVTAQTVLPDEGFDYLSQVNIAAIPYSEVENAQGGKTVTIG